MDFYTPQEVADVLRGAGTGDYDLRHAASLLAAPFAPVPFRRLRIELVPRKAKRCIAVKLSEECGPELAPEGEPRTWHPCGDPASGPFLQARTTILEKLGVENVGEND